MIADAAARLLDQRTQNVVDRKGNRVPSLVHLVLRPLQELDRRVVASGASRPLGDLLLALYEATLKRVTVNGQEKLENETFVPFLSKALDDLASGVPADPATRRSEVTKAQKQAASFLPSSALGTFVSIGRAIVKSPQKAVVDRSLVNLLTPNKTVKDDIFGAVVKVLCFGFQLHQHPSAVSQTSLVDLLRFAGDAVDPTRPVVNDAVQGITKVLTNDKGKTVLSVYRAALNPAPGELLAPAAILLHIVDDVSNAGAAAAGGTRTATSGTDVRASVQWAVTFIRDKQSGLAYIFELIKNRQK